MATAVSEMPRDNDTKKQNAPALRRVLMPVVIMPLGLSVMLYPV